MSRYLSVKVDQDLYEKLVSIAVKRYGRVRGAMKRVLLEALEEYAKRYGDNAGGADTK